MKKTISQYSSSASSSFSSQDTLMKLELGSLNSRKKDLTDSVQLSKSAAFRINTQNNHNNRNGQNSSRTYLQNSSSYSQNSPNSPNYSPSLRTLRPLSQQLLPSDRMRELQVMLCESNDRVCDLTNQISSDISTLSGIGAFNIINKNKNKDDDKYGIENRNESKNENRNENDFNRRNTAIAFAKQLGSRK